MKSICLLLFSLLLSGCAGLPKGIEPVTNFKLDRYLGQWYEVARLDHRFERGLEQVTATYSTNDDGSVRVVNRGFSTKSGKWEDATGKARFAGNPDVGYLEVSFFGPFFGSYVIFELDKENYQYAFITGSESTLWLLSRTPKISDSVKENFLKRIEEYGYNSQELIFVNHE